MQNESLSALPAFVAELEAENAALRKDCVTMALRLMGEDEDTFAPETREAMARWEPKALALLRGETVQS